MNETEGEPIPSTKGEGDPATTKTFDWFLEISTLSQAGEGEIAAEPLEKIELTIPKAVLGELREWAQFRGRRVEELLGEGCQEYLAAVRGTLAHLHHLGIDPRQWHLVPRSQA